MVTRILQYYFIVLIILNAIERNDTLLSPLTHIFNKTVGISDRSLQIESLINTVELQIKPKFTNNNPTVSAIKAFQAGCDDEDIDLNITQLIIKNGFKVEEHTVTTVDGYILAMFRIPNHGPPVLLMHGLLLSADDWTTNGRNSSLAYLAADKGYDVWLGNARGNKHSRKHVFLDPDVDEDQFWDFSWDEIGRYDLPAMIDYILDATGQHKLIYIGHSQGCTSFFVMCSERPEYNEKILLMVALSAVAFFSHTTSPAFQTLAPLTYDEDAPLVKLLGPKLFADDLLESFKIILCNDATNVVTQLVCSSFLFLSAGFNYEQAHYERLGTIFSHLPAGIAIKQLQHYEQSLVDGYFRQFNYRYNKNEMVYRSMTPPEYPLENIRAPMAIFSSKGDWLNRITDLNSLLNRLENTNYSVHEVPDPRFAHLDYLFARDVKQLVYDNVMQLIEETLSV